MRLMTWQAFAFGANSYSNIALSASTDQILSAYSAVNVDASCVERGCFFSSISCSDCVATPFITSPFAGLDIVNFSLGRTHGMVIASETFGILEGSKPIPGRIYAFGDNSLGQLGTGDFSPRYGPQILRTCCQRAVDFEGRKFCLKWMDQVYNCYSGLPSGDDKCVRPMLI